MTFTHPTTSEQKKFNNIIAAAMNGNMTKLSLLEKSCRSDAKRNRSNQSMLLANLARRCFSHCECNGVFGGESLGKFATHVKAYL